MSLLESTAEVKRIHPADVDDCIWLGAFGVHSEAYDALDKVEGRHGKCGERFYRSSGVVALRAENGNAPSYGRFSMQYDQQIVGREPGGLFFVTVETGHATESKPGEIDNCRKEQTVSKQSVTIQWDRSMSTEPYYLARNSEHGELFLTPDLVQKAPSTFKEMCLLIGSISQSALLAELNPIVLA